MSEGDMELKEMIISTLAELEDSNQDEELQDAKAQSKKEDKIAIKDDLPNPMDVDSITSSEKQFYENIRERILVLFEGFQSPNNKNIEAKVDLTLNFLEYLLATIDERLENLKTKE
ncbi:MAG: hypothetical protein QM482_01965 [Sulfurospirillum sp.]